MCGCVAGCQCWSIEPESEAGDTITPCAKPTHDQIWAYVFYLLSSSITFVHIYTIKSRSAQIPNNFATTLYTHIEYVYCVPMHLNTRVLIAYRAQLCPSQCALSTISQSCIPAATCAPTGRIVAAVNRRAPVSTGWKRGGTQRRLIPVWNANASVCCTPEDVAANHTNRHDMNK